MNPIQQKEFGAPRYGWVATSSRMDRHLGEFVDALQAWEARDRERPEKHYGRALEIERITRNISADTAQLARLGRMGDEVMAP
jgi:hypothetical protein